MTNSQPTKSEVWKQVQQFYIDKFGATPELIEIATDFDILKMSASGSGNDKISEFLSVEEEVVASIIDMHFGFGGWKHDLEFSPLRVYKGLDTKDLESYRDVIIIQYGYQFTKKLDNMYRAAALVEKLERLLDEKWL